MRSLSRENLSLTLGTLLTLTILAIYSQGTHASVQSISCETNFGEKSFTIEGSTIAFHTQIDTGRAISSLSNSVTRKSHKGFTKTLYIKGDKHLIHIENQKDFNSNNDYLAITSPKGHKMTYPINCN